MALSIQTNVNAINAQENLRVNSEFQGRTIQRLTSGYRINSSGDDAAGLSVANKYRNDVTELQQGVRNANDGISSLQIIDGGLNNIGRVLDRLTTLATQAATDTFEGDRQILQNEYNTLLGEINRQAANIGLSTGSVGGRYNSQIGVYIGGGVGVEANSKVTVDLSLSSDRVDSTNLGISSTSITGGGNNELTGNSVDLRSGTFLAAGTQSLTFNLANVTVTATVGSAGSAITGAQAIDQLNSQISAYGISASINSTSGELQFSGGSTAFTVSAGAASAGNAIATASSTGNNNALSRANGQTTFATVATSDEVLSFTVGGGSSFDVTLAIGTTVTSALSQLNSELNSKGVYAVRNSAGTGIDFQSSNTFTVSRAGGAATGAFGSDGAKTVTAPAADATDTGNALAALDKLKEAVTKLGTTQGKVGTGLNKLQYAVQLAQSQISNFSAAESRIRDADVAAEAANLTKAQVLQQASLAAMAQANSAPQSILSLLRG